MTTLDRIHKIFIEDHEFDVKNLTPDSALENLGLDSLDKIEFMFSLEDEFKIKIPERQVSLVTIQDVVDTVDRLIAEQQAAS